MMSYSPTEEWSQLPFLFSRSVWRADVRWLPLVLSPTAAFAQATPATITLDVDATTLSRKILSAHESFPWASPLAHTVDLVYPKWIPGNHAPTGPIADLVNLRFTANGKSVAWARDPV